MAEALLAEAEVEKTPYLCTLFLKEKMVRGFLHLSLSQ